MLSSGTVTWSSSTRSTRDRGSMPDGDLGRDGGGGTPQDSHAPRGCASTESARRPTIGSAACPAVAAVGEAGGLGMPDQAPEDQAREFAVAFRGFLDWVHSTAAREDNEVSALVRDFLGPDGGHHSVVTRELPPFEHVNLQTAVDAWAAFAGRTVEVQGIALPPHYGGLSLQQLVAGEALPPLRLTAPALADLPNGPDSTLGCLRLALLLVTDHSGRYVVMINGPSEHEP